MAVQGPRSLARLIESAFVRAAPRAPDRQTAKPPYRHTAIPPYRHARRITTPPKPANSPARARPARHQTCAPAARGRRTSSAVASRRGMAACTAASTSTKRNPVWLHIPRLGTHTPRHGCHSTAAIHERPHISPHHQAAPSELASAHAPEPLLPSVCLVALCSPPAVFSIYMGRVQQRAKGLPHTSLEPFSLD
jgi:hypothetical protein